MIEQLENHIVDYDPTAVLRRTRDTVRCIESEWSKNHAEPIDEGRLRVFLCDEHRGDLTEEQKTLALRCRDEMRNVYGATVLRLLLCEEMLRRNIAPDFQTYRRVFCTEEGGTPWMFAKQDDHRFTLNKTKQEKALTLLGTRANHNIPQCGLFSGLPHDAL